MQFFCFTMWTSPKITVMTKSEARKKTPTGVIRLMEQTSSFHNLLKNGRHVHVHIHLNGSKLRKCIIHLLCIPTDPRLQTLLPPAANHQQTPRFKMANHQSSFSNSHRFASRHRVVPSIISRNSPLLWHGLVVY
uniref:GPI mannosyltransferase 3 n=1 Tax=Lygus hesperus TaxID=30085 RepID=A0A0A9WML3_LYGHE